MSLIGTSLIGTSLIDSPSRYPPSPAIRPDRQLLRSVESMISIVAPKLG